MGVHVAGHLVAELVDLAPELRFPAGLLEEQPERSVGWEIAPDGLTNVLRTIHDRYGNPPVYVAENGAAFTDIVAADGTITDDRRRSYLNDHLRAAHAAIRAGVDLRGWNVWSLLDDADTCFGLIHVDYESHEGTIKSSGHWYHDVIAANGLRHPGTD
jgi:beta-glucosidase